MANAFDQFDAAPAKSNPFDQFDAAPGKPGVVEDVAKSLPVGVA